MDPHSRRAVAARIGLAAVASWLVLGAAQGAAATVADAEGRAVTVADASRIVSIGGAVTEILYALGLDDRIVAVDTTSLYPPRAAREKPSVGYMRQLSAEGVLGLNPTLVLASEAAGPQETMAVLKAAAVPLVLVPERHTGEGILDKVALIAQATGAEGACLIEAIRHDLSALARIRRGVERPPRVLFVLSFMNGRPLAAGRDTAADGIIRLAGAANAVDQYEGYKPLADEAVIAAQPDVVLAMERPGATLDAETVFAQAAFALTPAARQKRFIAMDGLYLLGFGPRTARAARDLAVALHAVGAAEPLPSETAGRVESCR